jgi:molybdopterin/thiamine biosynthesis adenylyltransferase
MSTTEQTNPSATADGQTPVELIRRQLDPRLVTRGRVVIIGLGGIGLYLARSLVTFLAGLRAGLEPDEDITLLLVDGKVFSERHCYRIDVPDFGNKAVVLAEELLERHECPGLNIRYLPEFVTAENVRHVIQNGDCVLLCVDNHATRNLVGRFCAGGELSEVVLISGGNDGVENGRLGTYGNVQVHIREGGVDRTAPLHHFHPDIAEPADQSPAELGCDESGVPQLTVTNMFAAAMMASALLRLIMQADPGRPYDEVAFDVVEGVAQPHWLTESEAGNPSSKAPSADLRDQPHVRGPR